MKQGLISSDHHLLEACLYGLLSLVRLPEKGSADLFSASAVLERIFDGTGQVGEAAYLWEITRWKHRGQSEVGLLAGSHANDDFLAWSNDADLFEPNWRVYPEATFRALFAEACTRWVLEHPEFRQEMGRALAKHGMHYV